MWIMIRIAKSGGTNAAGPEQNADHDPYSAEEARAAVWAAPRCPRIILGYHGGTGVEFGSLVLSPAETAGQVFSPAKTAGARN